jgi:mRNA-degrading endonuclease toxin of MazEF toxin-antitoxin module
MEKDFDAWNDAKKGIHKEDARTFCRPREIWWCSLGINVGDEQDGTGEKYYFPIGIVDDREASAVLSQVRLIDGKRLVRKIAMLDEEIFKELKSALQRTLFETP